MASRSPSPFASPFPGLRIKKGAPAIVRPTREEIDAFPGEARALLDRTWADQKKVVDNYDLRWMAGKHFLLAGATGQGIGAAVASAVLNLMGEAGSVTAVARDITRSIGYATGEEMAARAESAGLGDRFRWTNDGVALEGKRLDSILEALKAAGADKVVYINTVAAASSGLLPNYPPVFVKDVDSEGLFQWELEPLPERNIESTKFVMGTMAVAFTEALENAGVEVELTAFADWRGSLDRTGRNPDALEYGRCGAYSTSLYLPKDVIQAATEAAYGTGRKMIDVFFPIMRTRALPFIPGGQTMSFLYEKLMELANVRRVDIPELGLGMLDVIGKTLTSEQFNPFPRLDSHESPMDLWFFEVVKRLNEDESSPYYYKHWIQDSRS